MSTTAAVLVIADDLTGANATAAGFARAGLRAVTVGADQDDAVIGDFVTRFDVVVVSTDSRHWGPERAARRVAAVVAAGARARLVCNRVDSTLRGNLGASTAAVLRELAGRVSRRTVALCVPAHPAAGRQTVEGRQLLDGVRLEDTEVARDPRTPLRTSRVAELLAEQAELRVAQLPLSAVTGDAQELTAAITDRLASGAEIIIADALTVSHLRSVARAAVIAGPDINWVSVDPGPGAVELATALGLTHNAAAAPVLAVSGSATELTRAQLARLRERLPVRLVRPRYLSASPVPDAQATAQALADELRVADAGDVVLLATVLEESDLVDLSTAEAADLPRELAVAVRRAVTPRSVDGVYVTGGDAAAALLAELGAAGLEVDTELAPLTVAGTVVSGSWEATPIVTKGGLVGEVNATVDSVKHLRGVADARRRRVRAAVTAGGLPSTQAI